MGLMEVREVIRLREAASGWGRDVDVCEVGMRDIARSLQPRMAHDCCRLHISYNRRYTSELEQGMPAALLVVTLLSSLSFIIARHKTHIIMYTVPGMAYILGYCSASTPPCHPASTLLPFQWDWVIAFTQRAQKSASIPSSPKDKRQSSVCCIYAPAERVSGCYSAADGVGTAVCFFKEVWFCSLVIFRHPFGSQNSEYGPKLLLLFLLRPCLRIFPLTAG